MPEGSKITAESSKAAAKVTRAFSPLDLGDKCFLCGHTIGEGQAPGFYQGKTSTVIAHRGCLDKMDMAGGTPKDFHRVVGNKSQAPVHDKPVHQDVENERAQVYATSSAPSQWRGPRSIRFDTFADLQTFILARGEIPSHVRVAIGDYVIQSGG